MTTQSNDKVSEVASRTPDYLQTAKAAWPFPHQKLMPRPDGLEIARAMQRGEALVAHQEILPDDCRCAINE